MTSSLHDLLARQLYKHKPFLPNGLFHHRNLYLDEQCSLCLNFFSPTRTCTCPKAKLRKVFYLLKQILSLFSLVRIQFYLSRVSGKCMGGSRGACTLKIGKNKIFWRKIVIFHTKYPKYFRASLCSVKIF
jgi:hypothetical protein